MLWKIQTPGGLNHGTRQKAPKDDGNALSLRFFLVAVKSMENQNKQRQARKARKGESGYSGNSRWVECSGTVEPDIHTSMLR